MSRKLSASLFIFPLCLLTGCAAGEKTAGLTVVYGAAAVLALLLLVGYCGAVRKKNLWIGVLFASVTVVNLGYFLLALSRSLEQALLANRLSYLGSVLLPVAMLMILLRTTGLRYPRWLPPVLLALAAGVLVIAASPGYLDIYYREVTFRIVEGAGSLQKVYGPWHKVYLIYLLGYFGTMLAVMIRAVVQKKLESTGQAVVLLIAVFGNLCVWFIEQLVRINFEILSLSYIISELFLLAVHWMATENARLQEMLIHQAVTDVRKQEIRKHQAEAAVSCTGEELEIYRRGLSELTPTEQTVYALYLEGHSTKEVLAQLNIKENTLKYHNRNIYSKLGVSSRKQMLAMTKIIQNP